MFMGALGRKEDAIDVLERRAAAFDMQIAATDAMVQAVPADLPRLFLIEEEYAQSMRRAELEWLRRIIGELKDGTLEWPQILEHHERPMS
jgi:hypothetical protein